MANNDGKIVLGLDVPKTVSQINTDIKKLQNQLAQVKLTGALDTSSTVKQINAQIAALQSQLKTIDIKANVNTAEAQKTGQTIGKTVADSAQKAIVGNVINIDKAHLSYDKLIQPASEEIRDINSLLEQTESTMRGMEKSGLLWTDTLRRAWKKIDKSGYAALLSQLQKIPKEVYKIDTAMSNLYKVTDETSNKYTQFLDSASSSAHDLGKSISSLIEQTANWAKLGFSLDEAEQLAKISSIYANVSGIDNDAAIGNMIAAMKAFNIEAADSITIVDKLYELGNEYTTSVADLGNGLSRSASSMASAGTDINETLAMLTGGTEITQNASEFGDFLKMSSMRIQGLKGELESLGEEVDETVDSISKVQTQILNRTGGKVNIFDDIGNFRGYYDIMKDISKVYDDLNASDKADLTAILFGRQRENQGAALIQAFQSGQVQKALEAAMNAEGSAMEEQERWLESLEAKTQQFEAAFQSLSSTVLDSNLLKWFVDFGTSSVQVLDSLINSLGSLGTIELAGIGYGISKFIKNLDCQKALKTA